MLKRILNWACPGILLICIFQFFMIISPMFSDSIIDVVFHILKILLVVSLIVLYTIIIKNRGKFEDNKYIGNILRIFTLVWILLSVASFTYTMFNKSIVPKYVKQDVSEVDSYSYLKLDFEVYNTDVKEIIGGSFDDGFSIDEVKFNKLMALDKNMHRKIKLASKAGIAQELNTKKEIPSKEYLGFLTYFKMKLFLLDNKKYQSINQ